ncbi:MAG: RidA family protein [Caulobacterales bacterium]|jgi:enamine deaminase RidA (YjgF/YER057c/UK114 family)|nr:RidA family protein [Caulobacterales bacterium]
MRAPSRRLIVSSLLASLAPGQAHAGRLVSPDRRIVELGINLPEPPRPAANYVAFRRVGRLIHLAGLGPANTVGEVAMGRVGVDLSVEQGYAAARAVGLNVLALLKSACGGTLNRVVQCVQISAFVASADEFHEQPRVANGASDLFVEVFGEAGLGARFAVGVNTLPFNIPVEIATVWEVR